MYNFFVFLFLCAGIIFACYFPGSYWVSGILCVLSWISALILDRFNKFLSFEIVILLFFFFIGALWVMPGVQTEKSLDNFIGREVEAGFLVTSFPKQVDTKRYFSAEITKINGTPCRATAYVTDYSGSRKEYLMSYSWRGKLFYWRQGEKKIRCFAMNKKSTGSKTGSVPGSKIVRGITLYVINVYDKYLSPQAKNFLASVFLGRRELMSREAVKMVRDSGMAHLLAISGLHIGMTGIVVFYLLKLAGFKHRPRIITAIAIILFYAFLSGARPSTVRAALMFSVFGISFLLERRTHPLNAFSLAGIALIMFNPLLIFDVGFQLSFIAVFGIIWGYRLFSVSIWRGNYLITYVNNIVFSSLFVTAAISPLIVFYFGKFYPLTPIENIFFIPVFTGIVFSNFVLLIFSPLPFVAGLLGKSVSFMTFVFMKMVSVFSSMDFCSIPCGMSLKTLFFYYFSLFAAGGIFYLVKNRNRLPGAEFRVSNK